MEKIKFTLDTQESGSLESGSLESAEFYVLEQTRLGGNQYLLVTDVQEGDGEALILKEVSGAGAREAVYEIVDDDTEMSAVAAVFENLLEDVELT